MALVPGVRPILEVGGRVFTDLANLIVLYGWVEGGTSKQSTMRKQDGSAGYQVAVSKTFKMWAARTKTFTAAASSAIANIGYADNDIGINTTTAFTNLVYRGGHQNCARLGSNLSSATDPLHEESFYFTVPAQKYVAAVFEGGVISQLECFGYEET